ncbi:PAS domain S-box protein [Leptolyngbya sp. FACHB-671]|uniref:hybrid sensor histidine kinase/response regulator n=1 Tax=Leptolyngbya sp. FACHB-671 TaxID=2692812 RepID=UPI0018EFBC47|nr:PAS domain S-box protein [Leptolyngbya sp. FACHB-671]
MNANSEHIFIGDSEMAALMQSRFASAENVTNGSSVSIGAIATWSPSFKTALNILLNACSPMFLVWGSDRLLFYNDAYSLLLRANDQPILVGQPISNSWNENWRQIQADVEQVFATGQPRRCENQPFPGDCSGRQCHYTWSYSPLWNEAGQIDGVFATGCRVLVEDSLPTPSNPTPQDLEEALYRREEQLRLVTNAVPALIAYVDKDHYYRFNNQTYEAWFGQRPSDLTGKHILEVLGEAAYKTVLPYIEQALSGQRVSFESQISYQTGGTRYVSAGYVPHVNSQGAVEGFFSLVSDITDRKRVEEALRESEAQIQLAVQIGRLGSWRYDPATNLVELDKRMREIWGEPEDAVFLPLSTVLERIHPQDQERVVSAISHALSPTSSGAYEIDYRILVGDGIERWISANGQVQFDGEGASRQPVEFIGTAIDITNRKQTEMALIAQEQRYRYIFEAVSISIWEEDFSQVRAAIAHLKASGVKDFRQYFTDRPEFVQQAIAMVHLRDVNQATLRLFRAQSKAELLNSLYQIFTPEAEAIFVEELLAIADEKPSYAAETVLQTLQGDRFPVWFTIAFPPASAAYDRVLVSLVDISDRVYAEAALRESESRFRGVVESNMVGILFWDASGCITAGNEMAVQMLGYSQEELQSGQVQWQNITPLEFHEIDAAMQAQLLADGVCPPFEKAYIRKDGTQVPILIGGALLPGYSDRGVAYFIDIADRKQVENALRQSEERYRYLAESIPQLVWTANAEGILLDINQRWMDYTGLTLEQAQIEGWQAVIHPDDIAELTHDWAAAQQNDTHYQAEGRMRRADGVYRWHLHQAVPLKDAQGKILKWFGTATDIEEQKQLQQEREYLLQREQAARAEAESANRVKDEFLAVLSHELRSPLNPILGWSRLLQDGKLDETKAKHALATIERNAKLQAELIEDLLDVSRILRGKLSLAVSPVNLAATIRAAIETVRLAAEAKSIRIESDLAPTTQAAGDATRLQQVMWNLLSNAVKFTPPGGLVKVRLEQVESDREAQITITDTGKGIDPSFLPYIFDYFRQADSATTRQFGGLGLGLAIVRHLIELHGGTIQAESKGEGLGATFIVRLPLLKDENEGMNETDPLHPSSFIPHPLAHVCVLLVDDDTDTRELVEFLLEQAGAKVTAVTTAGEALSILKRSPPDVLLSDIGMPDMDGYMLMRQVRTLPPEQGGQVKAIALTAYAGDFNQQQALAAGFQQHMSKPIDPEMLVKAIAALTGTLPNRYHQDR